MSLRRSKYREVNFVLCQISIFFFHIVNMSSEETVRAANDFVDFINKSPSPYHAVDECRKRLVAAGFIELKETDHWDIKPNDKCFVTRNQSTMVAFAVGGKYQPGNGFTMIGAHTDSPCLKIKPVSVRSKLGYLQVGVETYGGGTWHTWFDRDLKLAGRVIVKTDSGLVHRLLHVNRPLMRLPNVAIHLAREMGQEFKFNKEVNFSPVLATTYIEEKLNGNKCASSDDKEKCQADKHHSVLVDLIAKELNVKREDVMDFELCLADCQDAAIGGICEEFVFAARCDNLISTFCSTEGLIASCADNSLSEDTNIRTITLYDNEEVGSQSAQGAASTFTELVMRRLAVSSTAPTTFEEAIPRSIMLSCDVAHAVHPNYSEKHEENHRPAFHKGLVIKYNANQRYATTAVTSSILREVAKKADLPLQDFVIRQDMACGSTIGPISSAKLGIMTVDLGQPLLSMHSIREMADITSVYQSIVLFKEFMKSYPSVFASFQM